MTILITGATGMFGQALMAEGRVRGLPVVGLARKNTDISCDITEDASLDAVFAEYNPSLVIHTAAMADIGQCSADPAAAWAINARAVSVLAALCRDHGAKMVQVSTEHYFSGDGDLLHDEEAPITLLNDYARQKFAGEAFAALSPGALILRTNIVGLRGLDKPTFLEWALNLIRCDDEAILFADAFVSSIDVGAAAKALYDLVDAGASGVLNLGCRETFSKATFIRNLAAALGQTLTRAKNGSVKTLTVQRADSLGLDVRRAEAILGYQLPTLADVILALVDRDSENR